MCVLNLRTQNVPQCAYSRCVLNVRNQESRCVLNVRNQESRCVLNVLNQESRCVGIVRNPKNLDFI